MTKMFLQTKTCLNLCVPPDFEMYPQFSMTGGTCTPTFEIEWACCVHPAQKNCKSHPEIKTKNPPRFLFILKPAPEHILKISSYSEHYVYFRTIGGHKLPITNKLI
jgi:hypothetical protein